MREGDPYVVRLFLNRVPAFLDTWRKGPSFAEWHRHYLVGPGYGLALVKGERVELTRLRVADGFRVEQNMLSAAFPLDWMALTCISVAMPAALKDVEIDGRTPQAFVDSLAVEALPQASVLKETETAYLGTMVARITRLTVPDHGASGLMVAIEGRNAHALRTILGAAGLGGIPHRDLDSWLREIIVGPAEAKPAKPRRAA